MGWIAQLRAEKKSEAGRQLVGICSELRNPIMGLKLRILNNINKGYSSSQEQGSDSTINAGLGPDLNTALQIYDQQKTENTTILLNAGKDKDHKDQSHHHGTTKDGGKEGSNNYHGGKDDENLLDLDILILLLDYRDACVTKMLEGVLYEKAVLDWDLKVQRDFSDPLMVQMIERVVNFYTKKNSIPAKLPNSYPNFFKPRAFTLTQPENSSVVADSNKETKESKKKKEVSSAKKDDDKKYDKKDPSTTVLPDYPGYLLSVLQEFQHVGRNLRTLHLGKTVQVEDGYTVSAADLRTEITTWYKKATNLEFELQELKASRHAPIHEQVSALQSKLASKEDTLMELFRKKKSAEQEVSNLKTEKAELVVRIKEISEKLDFVAGNVTRLEMIEDVSKRSKHSLDVLLNDSELLSMVFRSQVEENRKMSIRKSELETEVRNLRDAIKLEKRRLVYVEDEVQKKSALILRVMAAKSVAQESYQEQKKKADLIEEKNKQLQMEIKKLKEEKKEVQERLEAIEREIHKVGQTQKQDAQDAIYAIHDHEGGVLGEYDSIDNTNFASQTTSFVVDRNQFVYDHDQNSKKNPNNIVVDVDKDKNIVDIDRDKNIHSLNPRLLMESSGSNSKKSVEKSVELGGSSDGQKSQTDGQKSHQKTGATLGGTALGGDGFLNDMNALNERFITMSQQGNQMTASKTASEDTNRSWNKRRDKSSIIGQPGKNLSGDSSAGTDSRGPDGPLMREMMKTEMDGMMKTEIDGGDPARSLLFNRSAQQHDGRERSGSTSTVGSGRTKRVEFKKKKSSASLERAVGPLKEMQPGGVHPSCGTRSSHTIAEQAESSTPQSSSFTGNLPGQVDHNPPSDH